MKVIITMAGEGSRFRRSGYTVPKHEIEVNGKTLFEWSLMSLAAFFECEFVFIVRSGSFDPAFISSRCYSLGIRKYCFIETLQKTKGQASSVMLADSVITSEDDVLIYNIDTYIADGCVTRDGIVRGDGNLVVFEAEGAHWSFVQPLPDGYVAKVTEKVRISSLASVGMYWFRRWDDFCHVYRSYADCVEMEYGETYIAPFYNYLIADGQAVTYTQVPSEKVHPLGTPAEVEYFQSLKLSQSQPS